MAEAKRREFRPKVIERRKVEIPHYDLGGIVGGIFSGLAGDMTTQNQYQAQLAPTMNTDYRSMIGNAGTNALAGYGNFNANQAQQQNLANALQGIANGQGPNPAQAMLNQSTGANVANQAALMAGQRGAGANAGLIARQAAMAGSNAQQQEAGQAATLQAQQSLGALGQQGQVLGEMGRQNLGEQGVNAGLFGSAAGAQNAQNNSLINNYNMMQGINSGVSQQNTGAINTTMGGLMNGLGGAVGLAFPKTPVTKAHGGMIGMANGGIIPNHLKHVHSIYHADGGVVQPNTTATNTATSTATSTNTATQPTPVQERTRKSMERELGAWAIEGYADGGITVAPDFRGVQAKIGNWATDGMSDKQMDAERVNSDPRTSSPEEMLPSNVKGMAVSDFRSGGRVPGSARVSGDSLKNDTQPAMLSPKEIVLPRSITMDPDAPEKAKEFVAALLKKQGHGNSKHHKEFHKALKEAILSRKKKSGE